MHKQKSMVERGFIGLVDDLSNEKREWLKEHKEQIFVDEFSFVYLTEELLILYILKWP